MRLTSWEKKGLSWGDSTELTRLQTCIKSMKDKNIKLVNVIQVMLVRRILACQRRGIQSAGVRLGRTPDAPEALRYDAQRRMEGVVQGLRSTSSNIRGPRASRRTGS